MCVRGVCVCSFPFLTLISAFSRAIFSPQIFNPLTPSISPSHTEIRSLNIPLISSVPRKRDRELMEKEGINDVTASDSIRGPATQAFTNRSPVCGCDRAHAQAHASRHDCGAWLRGAQGWGHKRHILSRSPCRARQGKTCGRKYPTVLLPQLLCLPTSINHRSLLICVENEGGRRPSYL